MILLATLAAPFPAHAFLCDRFVPVGLLDSLTAAVRVTNIGSTKIPACDVVVAFLDSTGQPLLEVEKTIAPGATATVNYALADGSAKTIVRADVRAGATNPCNLRKGILASEEIFDSATGQTVTLLAPYIAPK
jgi:hypothetical protein